jgi:hypothetical protein
MAIPFAGEVNFTNTFNSMKKPALGSDGLRQKPAAAAGFPLQF